MTEDYGGGDASFGVDHFRPTRHFPELICVYANLYYACNGCNSHKRDTWPDGRLRLLGYVFADRCATDVYGLHLLEKVDGTLECMTRYIHLAPGDFEHARMELEALLACRKRLARDAR